MSILPRFSGGLLVLSLLSVGACTTTNEIIIDKKGVDLARYAADKAECEAYADEVRTGEKAARGAASGAVVGGAVGAIVRDSTDGAIQGAGVGAVTGGVRGLSEGERDKVRVVKRCLSGRGYRVLN
ncbi:MAG: YMGG-like glycine zipper-containing protein [Congregibacter sp.]|nr:YMGG-like glycine zipper-containing protein [Congregibacter sp.]MDP5071560.1 YMGG-like glycine zipper-containing protein [Congregibacter sp.]